MYLLSTHCRAMALWGFPQAPSHWTQNLRTQRDPLRDRPPHSSPSRCPLVSFCPARPSLSETISAWVALMIRSPFLLWIPNMHHGGCPSLMELASRFSSLFLPDLIYLSSYYTYIARGAFHHRSRYSFIPGGGCGERAEGGWCPQGGALEDHGTGVPAGAQHPASDTQDPREAPSWGPLGGFLLDQPDDFLFFPRMCVCVLEGRRIYCTQ